MAKLKIPLLSLRAVGSLAKTLAFRVWKKHTIAEKIPIPSDTKSLAQLAWRHMYQKAIALWHALSETEQQEWESLARPKHMTGYAYFISLALKPNPGLYLPLQGGHMVGNVTADPGVTFDGVDLSEIPLGDYLLLAGGTMAGAIAMATHKITGLGDPTLAQDAATKSYADAKTLSSKTLYATRDLAAASGDVSYAGIGFTPSCMYNECTIVGGESASWGFVDSAKSGDTMAQRSNGTISRASPYCLFFVTSADDSAYQAAIVKSYDADGFTLTWLKGGLPTGTLVIHFLCLK